MPDLQQVTLILMHHCVMDECSAYVILLSGDVSANVRKQIYRNDDGFSRAFSSYGSWKRQGKALFYWSGDANQNAERGAAERIASQGKNVYREQSERLRAEGWHAQSPDEDRGWRVTVFERQTPA